MDNEYTLQFASFCLDWPNSTTLNSPHFCLYGVAPIPSLHLPDGKHRDAEWQKVLRNNVWVVLEICWKNKRAEAFKISRFSPYSFLVFMLLKPY
ncbi:MAG: hypothetical protein WBP08_02175 [Saprospiraceae bacterium]|jgi:hypothetical protein